ncbi:hypothetical protein ACEQ8H_005864 [Pleosporales sp. CAS-2024a]
MDDLSDEHIVTLFDQLVSEGVIMYGPHTKHLVEDDGYPTYQMEFRICDALTKKPHTVGASNTSFSHTSKWGPGSDMFIPDPRLILCQVHSTHDLALNLFCVDRPQLLMATRDSYRRQHEALDGEDFGAMLALLRRLHGWYVVFNCGERGGCSRLHKHMQGLRGPPHAFEKLVAAAASERHKGGDQQVPVPVPPFQFFLTRWESGFQNVQVADLLHVYTDMLVKSRRLLHLGEKDDCPHNVLLWDDCLVVIPRRRGAWNGASANTGGMMGSVWVPHHADVEKWLQLGCANVLRQLGVSR